MATIERNDYDTAHTVAAISGLVSWFCLMLRPQRLDQGRLKTTFLGFLPNTTKQQYLKLNAGRPYCKVAAAPSFGTHLNSSTHKTTSTHNCSCRLDTAFTLMANKDRTRKHSPPQ